MKEIWKKYYDTNYYVSNLGNIKSYYPSTKNWRNKVLTTSNRGYLRVSFNLNKKYTMKLVHRLVGELFIPNPNNLPQINHINGIKTDNRIENLEWCDASYNLKHSYKALGRTDNRNRNQKLGMAKLTDDQVEYIRQTYIPFHKDFSATKLAEKFGIKSNTISYIVNNKTWV